MTGPPPENDLIALANWRAARRVAGKPFHLLPEELEANARRITAEELGKLEREIQAEGTKRFLAMGWVHYNFSQVRPSKQAEGIADSRYYCLDFGALGKLWVEWKAPDGKQKPAQVELQRYCDATDDPYVCGGLGDVERYLVEHGLATVDGAGQWVSTRRRG